MKWISVKERHAPPMETVILFIAGQVMVGWNEAVMPDEKAAYVSWEWFPYIDDAEAEPTHWMALPKGPNE